jgi:hypothetical protein
MKQLIIIIFTLFFILSCRNSENIKYEYKGVFVMRVDEGVTSYFYYGNLNDDSPKSYIKCRYNGLDGIMDGYLIFENSKKVRLLTKYGKFEKVGLDSNLYLINYYEYIDYNKWKDSIKGSYNNVIEITDGITDNFKTEKLLNTKNRSKVKATYP